MRGRVEALLRSGTRGMWVGTFHGLAHRLLRLHWRRPACRRASRCSTSDDQLRLVKRIAAGARARRRPLPAAAAGLVDQRAEGRGPAPAAHPGRRRRLLRHDACCSVYEEYEERCQRAGPGRFRRAAAARARTAGCDNPALLHALPAALRPPAGRRVPGHQQRSSTRSCACSPATPARCSWSATTTRRSTAGAAPRSRTCSASCDDYPGAQHVQARAELPLHRQHPGRRQRGDRAQPRAPRQEAVDRRRRGRADRPVRRLQRGGRGALRGRAHPRVDRATAAAPATARVLYRSQRAVARDRRAAASGRACPTACTAASASSSAWRSRTRSPTCAWSRNRDDDAAFERAVNTPPRGIGERTLDEVRRQRARRRRCRCGRRRRSRWRPAATRARRAARATRCAASRDWSTSSRPACADLPLHEQFDHVLERSGPARALRRRVEGPARFARRQPRRAGVGRQPLRAARRRGRPRA